MSYLLLTGSTGMLGSYLLRDLLIAREPVAVIVRDRATETAQARVEALLQHWERELQRYLPRPKVIVGNLHEPSLGVSDSDQTWLAANCTRVLHSAACVSFQPEPATGEPYRSNLEGTRHVLQLCEQTGIKKFYHVSTAYLGGSEGDKHFEQPVDPQAASFRNDYEKSKAQAEKLVREASFLDHPTFLRPSIIVGDSQTGFAASYRGIDTALRLGYLHLIAKLQEGWKLDLELVREVVEGQFIQLLGLDGSERKDLVPVDWVSQSVLQLMHSPSARGGVFHLTSSDPTRIDTMAEAMIAAALESLESQTSKRAGIPTALMESVGFREHMETYQPYFSDDPKFDRTHLLREEAVPCPTLDHETLVRLWRTSIEADFSWRPAPVKSSTLNIESKLASLPSQLRDDSQVQWTDGLALELSGAGGGSWHVAFAG
ncbi:MAG: SDR family oxidoreductase, partial [Lacipirellulaceae bacterium]